MPSQEGTTFNTFVHKSQLVVSINYTFLIIKVQRRYGLIQYVLNCILLLAFLTFL